MGWAKKGKRLRIPTTSQHHARLNIFGWVVPLLGKRGMIRSPQGNRTGFLKCLKQISHRLQKYTIWLYVDQAKWHKGEEVKIFCENHPRFHLEYLPSYQPALNAQERVWRRIRYEATTNRYFVGLDEIWTVVKKSTHSWSPSKIKHLCQLT